MTKIEKGDFLTLCWWLMLCYVTTPPSSYTYCVPYTHTKHCVSVRYISPQLSLSHKYQLKGYIQVQSFQPKNPNPNLVSSFFEVGKKY